PMGLSVSEVMPPVPALPPASMPVVAVLPPASTPVVAVLPPASAPVAPSVVLVFGAPPSPLLVTPLAVPGIPPLPVAPAVVVIVVVGAPPAAALALLSLVPIAPALAVVLTPGSSPALEPLPGGIGSSPDPPQAARGSKSEHTRDPTPMRERSVIDSRTPAT